MKEKDKYSIPPIPKLDFSNVKDDIDDSHYNYIKYLHQKNQKIDQKNIVGTKGK